MMNEAEITLFAILQLTFYTWDTSVHLNEISWILYFNFKATNTAALKQFLENISNEILSTYFVYLWCS